MGWVPITTQDVINEISNAEQVGLTAAQANGQSVIPALQNILDKVVRSTRGYCKAGGNIVGQPGTIPEQLFSEVVAIARWRWICAIPKLKFLQTDERRQLYKDAQETLRDVARGAPAIEQPTDAQSLNTQTAAPVNQVQTASHARRTTSAVFPSGRVIDRMRGLI